MKGEMGDRISVKREGKAVLRKAPVVSVIPEIAQRLSGISHLRSLHPGRADRQACEVADQRWRAVGDDRGMDYFGTRPFPSSRKSRSDCPGSRTSEACTQAVPIGSLRGPGSALARCPGRQGGWITSESTRCCRHPGNRVATVRDLAPEKSAPRPCRPASLRGLGSALARCRGRQGGCLNPRVRSPAP